MFIFRPSLITTTLLLFLFSSQTLIATNQENQEWKINVSAKITGAAADKVWPLVADFCNLYKIFPTDVSFCVKGVVGKPGQVRYSASKTPSDDNATIVLWAEEKLIAIDETKRYVTYEILDNNRGINRFIGTMEILPINDGYSGYSCEFKWSIVADPVNGTTYEAFLDLVTSTRDQMVEKIDNLFSAN